MSVLLHIGLFKTGTTSIQRYLREHEQSLLAPHAMRFPNGWLRRDCHLEPHFVFMRPERDSSARRQGDEWHDPAWCDDLLAQMQADLAAHPKELTILSGEHTSLLRYDDEIGPLRALVGDATVVVALRNRADFLASLRDQLLKNGIAPSADPDSYAYVESDSWRADHDATLDAWSRHFDDVRVLDYDDAVARDGSVIPRFLALLGLPASEQPGDRRRYWLNARGEKDPRIPGNRASGLLFGAPT